MKPFNVVDLVIVAGQTVGIGTSAALDEVDIPAARAALDEAGCQGAVLADQDSAADAGIALMVALLRHRPFPMDGDRIAVAAGLQFLSMNGWQAELDPPATAAVVVEALAGGRLSQAAAAAWLSPRLTLDKRRSQSGAKPASVGYPQFLLFIQAGGWAAATLLLFLATTDATAAGGSGLQELLGFGLMLATGGLTAGKVLLGARINRSRSPRTRRLIIITEIAMTCFGLLWLLIPSWGGGWGWVVPGVIGALLSLAAVLCMNRPDAHLYFDQADRAPGTRKPGRLARPASFRRLALAERALAVA